MVSFTISKIGTRYKRPTSVSGSGTTKENAQKVSNPLKTSQFCGEDQVGGANCIRADVYEKEMKVVETVPTVDKLSIPVDLDGGDGASFISIQRNPEESKNAGGLGEHILSSEDNLPCSVEASFALNLFQDGFTVRRPTERGKSPPLGFEVMENVYPYDRTTAGFISDIDSGWIPHSLLEDIPCKYVDGRIVCELRDYRQAIPADSRDSWSCSPSTNSVTPKEWVAVVRNVRLRPTAETISSDIAAMADDTWTYTDMMEVEARILKAVQPALCLEATPEVAKKAYISNYNKMKFNVGRRMFRRYRMPKEAHGVRCQRIAAAAKALGKLGRLTTANKLERMLAGYRLVDAKPRTKSTPESATESIKHGQPQAQQGLQLQSSTSQGSSGPMNLNRVGMPGVPTATAISPVQVPSLPSTIHGTPSVVTSANESTELGGDMKVGSGSSLLGKRDSKELAAAARAEARRMKNSQVRPEKYHHEHLKTQRRQDVKLCPKETQRNEMVQQQPQSKFENRRSTDCISQKQLQQLGVQTPLGSHSHRRASGPFDQDQFDGNTLPIEIRNTLHVAKQELKESQKVGMDWESLKFDIQEEADTHQLSQLDQSDLQLQQQPQTPQTPYLLQAREQMDQFAPGRQQLGHVGKTKVGLKLEDMGKKEEMPQRKLRARLKDNQKPGQMQSLGLMKTGSNSSSGLSGLPPIGFVGSPLVPALPSGSGPKSLSQLASNFPSNTGHEYLMSMAQVQAHTRASQMKACAIQRCSNSLPKIQVVASRNEESKDAIAELLDVIHRNKLHHRKIPKLELPPRRKNCTSFQVLEATLSDCTASDECEEPKGRKRMANSLVGGNVNSRRIRILQFNKTEQISPGSGMSPSVSERLRVMFCGRNKDTVVAVTKLLDAESHAGVVPPHHVFPCMANDASASHRQHMKIDRVVQDRLFQIVWNPHEGEKADQFEAQYAILMEKEGWELVKNEVKAAMPRGAQSMTASAASSASHMQAQDSTSANSVGHMRTSVRGLVNQQHMTGLLRPRCVSALSQLQRSSPSVLAAARMPLDDTLLKPGCASAISQRQQSPTNALAAAQQTIQLGASKVMQEDVKSQQLQQKLQEHPHQGHQPQPQQQQEQQQHLQPQYYPIQQHSHQEHEQKYQQSMRQLPLNQQQRQLSTRQPVQNQLQYQQNTNQNTEQRIPNQQMGQLVPNQQEHHQNIIQLLLNQQEHQQNVRQIHPNQQLGHRNQQMRQIQQLEHPNQQLKHIHPFQQLRQLVSYQQEHPQNVRQIHRNQQLGHLVPYQHEHQQNKGLIMKHQLGYLVPKQQEHQQNTRKILPNQQLGQLVPNQHRQNTSQLVPNQQLIAHITAHNDSGQALAPQIVENEQIPYSQHPQNMMYGSMSNLDVSGVSGVGIPSTMSGIGGVGMGGMSRLSNMGHFSGMVRKGQPHRVANMLSSQTLDYLRTPSQTGLEAVGQPEYQANHVVFSKSRISAAGVRTPNPQIRGTADYFSSMVASDQMHTNPGVNQEMIMNQTLSRNGLAPMQLAPVLPGQKFYNNPQQANTGILGSSFGRSPSTQRNTEGTLASVVGITGSNFDLPNTNVFVSLRPQTPSPHVNTQGTLGYTSSSMDIQDESVFSSVNAVDNWRMFRTSQPQMGQPGQPF